MGKLGVKSPLRLFGKNRNKNRNNGDNSIVNTSLISMEDFGEEEVEPVVSFEEEDFAFTEDEPGMPFQRLRSNTSNNTASILRQSSYQSAQVKKVDPPQEGRHKKNMLLRRGQTPPQPSTRKLEEELKELKRMMSSKTTEEEIVGANGTIQIGRTWSQATRHNLEHALWRSNSCARLPSEQGFAPTVDESCFMQRAQPSYRVPTDERMGTLQHPTSSRMVRRVPLETYLDVEEDEEEVVKNVRFRREEEKTFDDSPADDHVVDEAGWDLGLYGCYTMKDQCFNPCAEALDVCVDASCIFLCIGNEDQTADDNNDKNAPKKRRFPAVISFGQQQREAPQKGNPPKVGRFRSLLRGRNETRD